MMMTRNRLTVTEKRLIWEQGLGLDIRENSASIGLLGFAAVLMVVSIVTPIAQLFYYSSW
ncbi:hypothetical protein KDL29_03855 [bacterium]|nr:hypothetical protein [bacterium]